MLTSLLTLGLSLALPMPQGQAPVTEVLPLQHLLGGHATASLPPWRTLLRHPGQDDRTPDLLGLGEEPTVLTTDGALDLLRDLHNEAVAAGKLHLEPLGTGLLAIGEATEIAKVRERLRLAAPLLARPVQIEFAVWDAADRETPNPVLSAAEFTRFFANLTPVSRGTATTRHGAAVALERLRWTRYVRDLDAEVAQKQSMTRPVTEQFGEGGHAVVRAFSLLAADEFAVHVQFAAAQRRGVVRTLQTGMAGAADLELPLLETDCGAFSGRIGNGGALAVTLRGHAAAGGQRIVTVRVSSRTPPANSVQDGLGIFPCAALTTSSLSQLPGLDDGAGHSGEPSGAEAHIPIESLLDFVRSNLGAETDGLGLRGGGGFLFASGPGPTLARIEGLLRGLQDRCVRNATVRSTGTLALDAAAASLHELTAPTLVGRGLSLARHLETNFLADVWATIAQEASTLDPGVELLQSGCAFTAVVTPTDEGMHLRLQLIDRHAVVPQARSIMPGGVLMTPEIALTRASHDGAVANGQPIEHGDGPNVNLDGRAYRSVLATLVRW